MISWKFPNFMLHRRYESNSKINFSRLRCYLGAGLPNAPTPIRSLHKTSNLPGSCNAPKYMESRARSGGTRVLPPDLKLVKVLKSRLQVTCYSKSIECWNIFQKLKLILRKAQRVLTFQYKCPFYSTLHIVDTDSS